MERNNKMELPTRDAKHVTEASSYKIFSRNIPNHWIIREVSERDYGIDCYIELVNNQNQVTGELISVQLKGKQKIKWTKNDYFTFSGINISTTNYWMKFPTPVFICLVDLETEEVFYSSVKESVRKNFYSYIKQDTFSYKIYKKDKLEVSTLENEKEWVDNKSKESESTQTASANKPQGSQETTQATTAAATTQSTAPYVVSETPSCSGTGTDKLWSDGRTSHSGPNGEDIFD